MYENRKNPNFPHNIPLLADFLIKFKAYYFSMVLEKKQFLVLSNTTFSDKVIYTDGNR